MRVHPNCVTSSKAPRRRDRLSFRGVPSLDLAVGNHDGHTAVPVRPSAGDLEWRREYRRRLEASPQSISTEEREARVRLLASSDFFAGCSGDELSLLAESSYPLAFDAGESLVSQNEPSPDAFVIAEGSANVIVDGKTVATLGADAVVGERGVLTGENRSATVRATSHLGVQVLSTERLRSIIESNPAAAEQMRRFVARYDQLDGARGPVGP